jgi:hypothetical protein
MDKDRIEQRWDGTMGQTAISCTDRKRPGSLPELRLTKVVVLEELQRAIIYTTKMSKQAPKKHVRDTVHMYLVN